MKNKSIKDFFEKNASSLSVPLIMIIIGLLFIFAPGGAVSFTVSVIGVIFVVVGLIMAGTLLASYSPFTMGISVALIVFGIICIARPAAIADFIIKVIGIVILVNSGFRIYDAYQIKGKTDNFVKYVINDIITFVLGLVLLCFSLNAVGAVVRVVGVFMLILGVTNVITAVKVYKDGRFVDDGSDIVWEE
ncbi:MAG: DUF308 domain-containing protein [Eubacterium sp.]|nr:DUF308 domain-containing protein [Eubacterium sp.]